MCALVLCLRELFVVWADPTRRRAHLVRATVLPFAFRGSGSLIEPFCFKSWIEKKKRKKTAHVVFHHYSAMPVIMRRFNLRRALPSIAFCVSRIRRRNESMRCCCFFLRVCCCFRPAGRRAAICTCTARGSLASRERLRGERHCLISVNKIFGRSSNWAQMWYVGGKKKKKKSDVWPLWENSLSADLCFDKFIKYTQLLHNK